MEARAQGEGAGGGGVVDGARDVVMALRFAGVLSVLAALVFNPLVLRLLRPQLDAVTARAVWQSLLLLLVSGVAFWGLSALVALGLRRPRVRRVLSRPLAGGLTLSLLTVLLPLLLAELFLRPFTVAHVPPKATSAFIQDDVLGWRLRPRVSDHYRGMVYAVNAKGLRGPELPYERRDRAARRILYLGDSVTVGFRLPEASAYPYLVQALLEGRGLRIETVNAGVDGYSPWQYDLYLRGEGLRYQPDLVVVGLVLNDVTEKFSLVRFGGSGPGVQLGLSYYSTHDWLKHHSGLYLVLDGLRTRWHRGQDVQAQAVRKEKLNVQDLVSKADSARIKEAWEVTFAELQSLVDVCRTNRLPLALVIFPYTFQFADVAAQSGPQAVIQAFARERGIPCLDLLPPLQAHLAAGALAPEALFLDNVHPSEDGSRLISGLIADFLLQTPEIRPALGLAAGGSAD